MSSDELLHVLTGRTHSLLGLHKVHTGLPDGFYLHVLQVARALYASVPPDDLGPINTAVKEICKTIKIA